MRRRDDTIYLVFAALFGSLVGVGLLIDDTALVVAGAMAGAVCLVLGWVLR